MAAQDEPKTDAPATDAPAADASATAVPLEELLEAAEAAVGAPQFSPRTLFTAMITAAILLIAVSALLVVATGGAWSHQARLLDLVVPRLVTPEGYRSRIVIQDADFRMVETPFGTQEVHVTGTLYNRGDRVLARADLEVRVRHVYRDESYDYTFIPVTPTGEGVNAPGPLLARSGRPFHYRIPNFPTEVEHRDVRVHWGIGAVEFHRGLPIPTPLPTSAS